MCVGGYGIYSVTSTSSERCKTAFVRIRYARMLDPRGVYLLRNSRDLIEAKAGGIVARRGPRSVRRCYQN